MYASDLSAINADKHFMNEGITQHAGDDNIRVGLPPVRDINRKGFCMIGGINSTNGYNLSMPQQALNHYRSNSVENTTGNLGITVQINNWFLGRVTYPCKQNVLPHILTNPSLKAHPPKK